SLMQKTPEDQLPHPSRIAVRVNTHHTPFFERDIFSIVRPTFFHRSFGIVPEMAAALSSLSLPFGRWCCPKFTQWRTWKLSRKRWKRLVEQKGPSISSPASKVPGLSTTLERLPPGDLY